MSVTTDRFEIPFARGPLSGLSAAFDHPDGTPRAAILFAHGAGSHLDHAFQVEAANQLAQAGYLVMRFNYAYSERARLEGKRKPPDRAPLLEEAHTKALEALAAEAPGVRLLLAGKSMGGRIGSHLAAKGEPCAGLVFFGYPLHPPGRRDRLRTEHFAAIAQPALFLQGSRDKLCDLTLLDEALQRYGGQTTVHVVEEADHSFHVPKRTGRTDEEVLESLIEQIRTWDATTFPD